MVTNEKKKSYFHFKFKLFWAAIFLVDAFFIAVATLYSCHIFVGVADYIGTYGFSFIFAACAQHIECSHSVASNIDIWLNAFAHLRFYDILSFSPLSLALSPSYSVSIGYFSQKLWPNG